MGPIRSLPRILYEGAVAGKVAIKRPSELCPVAGLTSCLHAKNNTDPRHHPRISQSSEMTPRGASGSVLLGARVGGGG